MFVTGSSDGKITVWDIKAMPTIMGTLQRSGRDPIVALGISENNTILAVEPGDMRGPVNVIEWDGKNTEYIHEPMSGQYVFDGVFSSSKNLLVLETWTQRVSLVDTKKMRLTVPSFCGGPCSGAFALSYDGDIIAVTDGWGNSAKIVLYDTTSQKKIADFRNPDVFSRDIALSPDNKILASASQSGLYLWDIETRELINSFEGGSKVAFSPDGLVFVSVSLNGDLVVRETKSGSTFFELKGFSSLGKSTFQGDFVASTYGRGSKTITISIDELAKGNSEFYSGDLETIFIRDITTGEIVRALTIPKEGARMRILSSVFSPDNTMMASLWFIDNQRTVVALFEITSGELLQTLNGDEPIAFSEDGSLLIIGFTGNKPIIWDIKSQEVLSLDTDLLPEEFVRKVDYSPDGTIYATQQANNIALRDAKSGDVLKILEGHTALIYDLAFSSDGKLLYSSSYDGTIIIWDMYKILP
ncbi:MAG TPA: hypothetical protein PLF42_04935 [Anaerolineales bacterium]|nr:hypothetical protein [Anaerolineales bacterium]